MENYNNGNYQPQQQRNFAFCTSCGNKYIIGDMFCKRCGKKIQSADPVTREQQNARQYEHAIRLLEAQSYDEAIRVFGMLGDYSDAKEKAQLCLQKKEEARKENLYLNAVAVLKLKRVSDVQIKNAIKALSSISDYKDSKTKIANLETVLEKWNEAKAAADEAARKAQYETATARLKAGLFDEAIRMFRVLGDYSDAKAQLEKALEGKETARKEEIYKRSISHLGEDKSPSEAELKGAIGALKTIESFKDSKDKIKALEARLEKWYEDKKAAEEAERLRKAQAKAKAKKITIITLTCLFIVAVIVAAIVFVTHPFEIVYDLDGGTVSKSNEGSYTFLTGDFTLTNPTKEGYTFTGWTGSKLDGATKDVTISRFSFGDKTYTATWKANDYSITLNPEGGSVDSDSVTVTFDSETELPKPSREGYTFDGWYVGDQLYSDGVWKDTSDLTLDAHWSANSYVITLNNIVQVHPAITITLNKNYTGSTPSTVKLTNGQKFEYPEIPVRSGYVFTGWYTDSACTRSYGFSGNITSDITLYAGWRQVTITNDSNYPWTMSGGILTSTNKINSSISEYSITAPVALKISFDYKTSSESSYDYLYIRKNGSNLKSCSGQKSSYESYSVSLSAGDTLSFVYKKDSSGSYGYDCAYIANLVIESSVIKSSTAKAKCGTQPYYEYRGGSKHTQDVTYDSAFTLPVPTRRGYAFLGWYSGDTKVESGTWNTADNVTLAARWEAGGNTITLDANGGSVSTNSVAAIFDKTYTLPTPTRVGYNFDGWYNGDVRYSGGTWTDVSDITLTARWTAKQYSVTIDDVKLKDIKVTLNYNYGSASDSTITLSDGETLGYPTVPTRSGYVFTGWYTDSACTNRYDFTGNITSDMTLYAGWEEMSVADVESESQILPYNYNSSTNYYSISTYGTSSSYKIHTYLVAEESGSHYIYYKNSYSSSSYRYYLQIYNLTQDTSIKTNGYVSSTSYDYYQFNCNKGDVIVISIYKYSSSSSYYSTAYFYFQGFDSVSSNAVAQASGYEYDESSSITNTISYGENVTLPTLSKTGYSFLGWFNGTTKVESGNWSIDSDVVLTPGWDVGRNVITLDYNGISSDNTTVNVTYGQEYTLPTPERTGYTFSGWFNGSTQYTGGTWLEESDVTLVARWTPKTYTITYLDVEAVNQELQVTYDYNYSGSTPTVVTLGDGDKLNFLTSPARNGYVFTGWYTDSACTDKYLFDRPITDNMTLYAGWNRYTVSNSSSYPWTVSGGNLTSTNKSNSSSSSYTITAPAAMTVSFYYRTSSESGCDYLYIQKNGSTLKSCSGETSSTHYTVTLNAGDTLTFMYQKDYSYSSGYDCAYITGLTVRSSMSINSTAIVHCNTFSDCIYSAGSSSTAMVSYGSTYALPSPTRTGYGFLGWYIGDTRVESGVWERDSNLTLTARWEAGRNVISLDPNGATLDETTIPVSFGEEYTLPDLEREGYTFEGWFNESTQYTSGVWSGETDVTLVARWTPKTYTITYSDAEEVHSSVSVTFDYNYSGSTPTVVTLNNGDYLNYPTNPTRSGGYIFSGWYTDSACTEKYLFNGTITEDMTLYAGWGSYSTSNNSTYPWSGSTNSLTSTNKGGGSSSTYTIYAYAPMTVSFYYRTSSEQNFDYLYIKKNGSTLKSCSGSTNDVYYSVSLNSGDSLSFTYTKDGSVSSGSDCAYITGLTFTSNEYISSSAIVECQEIDGAVYSSGSFITQSVEYGSETDLLNITRDGYTFLGWYNGDVLVGSGEWIIASDVTLTARWQ